MRVLAACSLGGAGHLQPLLPFLTAARRRGDDVLVIGPPALADMVERAGMPFVAGDEPAEADIAPIRERLPVAPPEEATVLGNRELFARLAATAMLPGMRATFASWSPDLVLRDPCEYASAVVADELGLRVAQVAISLAEAEVGSIAAAAPVLEQHRPGLVDALHRTPYLTRLPASLDPSPFATTIRFHDAPPPRRAALPDWWDGSTAPLVYVTFGSVLGHMTIAADVFRAALRAVADLDVRVLLTVGRVLDPATLGPIPPNVHVEAWVDQADVLAEAELVVNHGGSGTAYGTLDAGVPQVVVPVFADQFENARRIARSGAGAVVEVGDEQKLTDAIRTVLREPSYRAAAHRIATEVAATPTVETALATLFT